jgi:hypothetical protein
MHQVFYVDIDEEMIAVIGRLRKSPVRDNALVVPKRALILQSIVNLRLLGREAEKLGKNLLLVTQDEQGRLLAEKAGIPTQAALDETSSSESGLSQEPGMTSLQPSFVSATSSFSSQSVIKTPLPRQEVVEVGGNASAQLPRAETVGSSSFFGVQSTILQQPTQPVSPPSGFVSVPASPQKITVRDRSPKYLTALNSQMTETQSAGRLKEAVPSPRSAVEGKKAEGFTPQPRSQFTSFSQGGTGAVSGSFGGEIMNQPTAPTLPSSPASVRASAPTPAAPREWEAPRPFVSSSPGNTAPSVPMAAKSFPTPSSAPGGFEASKASAYFQNQKKQAELKRLTPNAPTTSSGPAAKPPKVPGGKKLKGVFFFFAFVSIFSLFGVAVYLFLPKADIEVKLKTVPQRSDVEFWGSEAAIASAADKTLPVRLVETEGEVKVSFEATGTSSLSDQKARGTVIIYNEYSTEPQTLVASTRLLSENGKLFRLVNGVTVPGMSESNGRQEPGAIEATVIADQSGTEYNIEATTFTIPGFQGSPKYAKFSAKSLKVMTGGGIGGSDAKAVSEEDIRKAKQAVEAQVEEEAQKVVEASLEAGEKVLTEAIETSILSSSASPQSGAVTDIFDYQVRFKAQALVFSEEALKQSITDIFKAKNAGKQPALTVKEVKIEYGEPTPDFAAKTLKIRLYADALLEPQLDVEQFKADLLGKSEDEIEDVLQGYPQVDKLTINFWPEFLISSIPSKGDRVTVSLDSQLGEE